MDADGEDRPEELNLFSKSSRKSKYDNNIKSI